MKVLVFWNGFLAGALGVGICMAVAQRRIIGRYRRVLSEIVSETGGRKGVVSYWRIKAAADLLIGRTKR